MAGTRVFRLPNDGAHFNCRVCGASVSYKKARLVPSRGFSGIVCFDCMTPETAVIKPEPFEVWESLTHAEREHIRATNP